MDMELPVHDETDIHTLNTLLTAQYTTILSKKIVAASLRTENKS